MESLKLIDSKKEFATFLSIFLLIFLFNIIHEYFKYKDLVYEEVYEDTFQIVNIYDKEDFYVLKVQNDDFSFFTSINKERAFKKLDSIHLAILTTKIDFLSFLKGFYAKSFYYDFVLEEVDFKQKLSNSITSSHENIKIQQLFNALFLAIPISKEYREIYTNFGISHLIAISGFHLAILSFIVYWAFYFPYSFLHQKYFPYRNKHFDILIITIGFLFFYVLLSDLVPSLLRAFVMFCLGVYFLRRNYDVISFQSLGITFLLIICFFPKFLFSISFWFSVIGVFYIFLYIKYFSSLNRYFAFLFFNFWIFFVFNPIVHFFFYNTSYEQLLSPFVTLVFTLFYPLELGLHLIGFGSLLDEYILIFLNYKMSIYEVQTPLWLFVFYVCASLGSIFSINAFYVLNILLVCFNIYLYSL